jgi:hypothetical protein
MKKIDLEIIDNKKIFANLLKLKASNEEEYNKYNRTIGKITKFIERFGIEYGNIEFRSIIRLSNKSVLSNYDLTNLFLNKAEIMKKNKIIGLQYYTNPEIKGKQLAANRITSFFKMIFSKRFYKKFRSLLGKVLIIQRYWRSCLMTKRARKLVLQSIKEKLEKHSILQKELTKSWPIIKTSNRFEIHICSYSL